MSERLDSKDWFLQRLLETAEENEKKMVWLLGAFLVIAFVSIAMNLSAIENVEVNLLFLKTTVAGAWPIRVFFALSATIAFTAIAYFALEAQKSLAGIEFMAVKDHDRASEVVQFGGWLLENKTSLIINSSRIALVLLFSAVLVELMVGATLIISLFA